MKKFKATRRKAKFEYEFKNGTTHEVEYLEPTTQQIDKSVDIDEDVKARLQYTKDVLQECLKADAGVVENIIEEQTENANIYEFKAQLDTELGKQIKKG